MSNVSSVTPEPRPRPRSPIRKVFVEAVEKVVPRLVRVTFASEELAGFGPPRPAAHIKLHIAPEGSAWSPADMATERPPRRTYTPRSFDPLRNRLVVDFVLHGEGVAAAWAQQAKPGQSMHVSGPGGGYDVPASASSLVLLADETALPAVETILASLPPGCAATVLAETEAADDVRSLGEPPGCEVRWLLRDASGAAPCSLLEIAAREIRPDSSSVWWVACEAAAMRRIRQHLLRERSVDSARLHTRGYWKLGETNYPDHDYGA